MNHQQRRDNMREIGRREGAPGNDRRAHGPCAAGAAGVAVRCFARVLTTYQFANIQQILFDLE